MPNVANTMMEEYVCGTTWRNRMRQGLAPRVFSASTRLLLRHFNTSACTIRAICGQYVNPTAMILSGKLMLDHLGESDAAERLERAVAAVIAEGERVTYDLKPSRDDPTAVGTSEYADAIIEKLGSSK